MDNLSGAITDHELLRNPVDPPVLPDEVGAQALAARRGKALSQNTARLLLLQACAVAVERELQRIVWPGGGGGARASTALVIVRERDFSVPYCPLYPETLSQALTSVRLWSDDAQDWTTLAAGDQQWLPATPQALASSWTWLGSTRSSRASRHRRRHRRTLSRRSLGCGHTATRCDLVTYQKSPASSKSWLAA